MGMNREMIPRYVGIALLGLAAFAPPAAAMDTQAEIEGGAKRASFAREIASRDVHHIADWVVDSGDNQGLPFVIVDKSNARVFVFDAGGLVRGAAPALLGFARGDDSAPGIGDREMADIRPEERTTPAGRFVAEGGRNYYGVDVIWVDYAAAISMHRVVTNKPEERRLQRLATPTSDDNRISWGCINLPARFFDTVVSPAFSGTRGIVYVLPETRIAREVFGSYDVGERARQRLAGRAAPAGGRLVADSAAR